MGIESHRGLWLSSFWIHKDDISWQRKLCSYTDFEGNSLEVALILPGRFSTISLRSHHWRGKQLRQRKEWKEKSPMDLWVRSSATPNRLQCSTCRSEVWLNTLCLWKRDLEQPSNILFLHTAAFPRKMLLNIAYMKCWSESGSEMSHFP